MFLSINIDLDWFMKNFFNEIVIVYFNERKIWGKIWLEKGVYRGMFMRDFCRRCFMC